MPSLTEVARPHYRFASGPNCLRQHYDLHIRIFHGDLLVRTANRSDKNDAHGWIKQIEICSFQATVESKLGNRASLLQATFNFFGACRPLRRNDEQRLAQVGYILPGSRRCLQTRHRF